MDEDWNTLTHLSIQDNHRPASVAACDKYYVVERETVFSRLRGTCNANIGKALPGILVEVIGVIGVESDALRARVYSRTEGEIWFRTEWKCYPVDLVPVSPLIWQLLRSVSSLPERVRLVKNKEFCKAVEGIRPNDKVWYCPDSNDAVPSTYLARVKFIGPVSELGDGYYFGLDLLVSFGFGLVFVLVGLGLSLWIVVSG